MRKATWLVLTLALVVLVAAPPLLAEEAKAPAEGKVKAAAKEKSEAKEKSAPALKGEYAIMASELKLTAEQQTEVAAKLAAREESIAAWQKDNMQKLETAQEALKKARESGDKGAAKKLGEEIKAINESRDKIMTDTAAAIRAILTPEQQQAWEGFSLYRQAMARYRKAELDGRPAQEGPRTVRCGRQGIGRRQGQGRGPGQTGQGHRGAADTRPERRPQARREGRRRKGGGREEGRREEGRREIASPCGARRPIIAVATRGPLGRRGGSASLLVN